MRSIIENWQGSDEELLETLNAKTIEKKDSTFYTSRHLMKVLEPDAFRLVYGTLKQAATVDPLAESAKTILDSAGLDFSDPLTQATIETLAAVGSWPTPIVSAVKGIGISYSSPAEGAIGRDATAEDVEAERRVIARDAALNAIAEKVNAAMGAASLAHEQQLDAAAITDAANQAWGN